MRPKSGLPKRKALRHMPVYSHALRTNPDAVSTLHPNTRGEVARDASSVLSMFCGCGGLDLGFLGGFRYLGEYFPCLPFNILDAIDNDAGAIDTYRLNISDHARTADLTSINVVDLPQARVLIGGFPCQDFSSSGPKVGFAGDRGQLYRVMVDYMREKKPDVVVGENVTHLATLHEGRYLSAILKDCESVGYRFLVWNLFAPDYGLSQSRRRLFLVGVREDLGWPPSAPAPTHSDAHLAIEHALKDLEEISDESVPNQSQYFVATKASSGGGQGDHANERGKLAYCIRANPKARVQFHYSLPRRLTVRECARLQSFPDDFVFPFATGRNMVFIGNAVPPLLGYHVAKCVAEFLRRIDAGERLPPPAVSGSVMTSPTTISRRSTRVVTGQRLLFSDQ
jgi:DNA (cytosine-5)-methyltransferase 1